MGAGGVDGHGAAVGTVRSTRTRNGSATGAPARRLPRVVRLDGVYGDARDRRAPHHRAAPAASRRAASSLRQLIASVRRVAAVSDGLEVGEDVAAAEGVDRLLRVADQHHRGLAGERPVEHLPLHRVGVLELVDEHDPPALAHPLPGRGVVVLEGVGEPGQQVVVRQDAEAALAPVDLGAHLLGEGVPLVGGCARRRRRRGRARPAGR